jgi:hypothetical protein
LDGRKKAQKGAKKELRTPFFFFRPLRFFAANSCSLGLPYPEHSSSFTISSAGMGAPKK